MASHAELAAMRRAITLSALALGTTSPNPPVGCVILDPSDTPVGEGYHIRKGGPHAEGQALATAGPRSRGATAVVTLEPCNHTGRTPACRQLLLDAGIARVVIAAMDPTSRGDGGAAVLAQAGLSVETGVLEPEARLVLGPWLQAQQLGRPHITWSYQAGPNGPEPIDEPLIERFRRAYDLVIRPDHTIIEGIPGGHGQDFTLPEHPNSHDTDTPADLWRAGARTLLLNMDATAAQPYLDRDLIDAITLGVTPTPGTGAQPPHLLPPGFAIHHINPDGPNLTLTAQAIRPDA
jgi:diaminohydroxyphosphoribosylaminopyrimidine deaminase/5-amino-6-(5-phosphoribosylamino)uracil reductase